MADPEGGGPEPEGVTLRAILVGVALSVASALWVRQAEIVVLATQVSESVPPVPALAVLVLLVGLNPLLRALGPRLGLSRGEQVTIYVFVATAVAICGPGCVRFLLSLLTAPYHYATPQNGFSALWHLIPAWLAVGDPRAVHGYYQGDPRHGVPWRLWLVPVLAWGAFLMALWGAMLCLVLLVRRRWIETERLAFPQVQLLLEMTVEGPGGAAFFRNPLMWLGFGLAALYNGVNIAHAFAPGMPAPGTGFDLAAALGPDLARRLGPVRLEYRPELIGFGFLVPTDICFSIWFFFVLARAESLFAHVYSWDVAGVPFEQEQSMGAFLVLGVWALWQVRGDLRRAPGPLLGLAACLLGLVGFCVRAGMDAWAATAYLVIVLLTALASARIRADAGVPLIWLFPFYQQKKVLLNLLGTAPFATGLPGTMTIFALLTFLARGYFSALIGYQVDGFKMAEAVRLPRRQMTGVLLLAAVVGIALAFWVHLSTFYRYGAENIGGGLWGSWISVPEFEAVRAAQPPDHVRTAATALGGLVTAGLLLARQSWAHLPLHPLGYAVTTAYGGLVWWPFLVVWVVKASVLRWGGVWLYRRAVPLFLGFALGHFFVAGVLWGLVGAFWPDAARAYGVWFG